MPVLTTEETITVPGSLMAMVMIRGQVVVLIVTSQVDITAVMNG